MPLANSSSTANSGYAKNQNIIPRNAYRLYMFKKTALPAVLAAIALIAGVVLLNNYFPKWIKNTQKQTVELNAKSHEQDNLILEGEKAQLQDELKAAEAEFNEKSIMYDSTVLQADKSDDEEILVYRAQIQAVDEAINFYNTPDKQENKVLYDADKLMDTIFNDIFKRDNIGADDLSGISITALEDTRTNTTSSDWLHYDSDISDTQFIMRGICDDPRMLSTFLYKLNDKTICPYIETARTKSIEASTIKTDEYVNANGDIVYETLNIYVFEILITPNIEEPETTAETEAEQPAA